MKLVLITILSFAIAIWLGTWAGHLANRNIKPVMVLENVAGE